MHLNRFVRWAILGLALLSLSGSVRGQDTPLKFTVRWDKVVSVSKTIPTLQVVVNPPLRRGTLVHDNAFQALHDLGADDVRYVPWLPYPRLGVAELEAPKNGMTFWDFSVIDPMTIDFLEATKGHSVILNFSTIPQWMYKTDKTVAYPDDPDKVVWDYEQGTELRDPSFKEVADYYARLLSWYTKGGFTDELGKRHESGYHYSIPMWEVLNEVDFEHVMTPQTYTGLYDAVVTAMKKVQPDIKFVGVALAMPGKRPDFFEYFLNHKNHKPGIPLDFLSYHFYAVPTPDEPLDIQQHTVFAQADGFLDTVRYIESIRKRLSPETRTTIDEIGIISADDNGQDQPGHEAKPIVDAYWNLAGAEYAYIFGALTTMGIDVAGESQLVGYPTQFPSVSMVDWKDGKPNARLWVLKLLHDNCGRGDKLVEIAPFSSSAPAQPYIYSLALVNKQGKRKILLINKRDRDFGVSVVGGAGGQLEAVDVTTGFQPPTGAKLASDEFTLHGFSVAVVTLP
ncbi:MAG: glycosyl hydrolase family 39 [Candidatus Acidiferrales bacterium]